MTTGTDISPLIRTDRWAGALPGRRDKPPSMRLFGAVILVGFGLLGALSLLTYRRTHAQWRLDAAMLFFGIATVVFVWSVVAPAGLPPVYRAWMAFGQRIGTIASTLVLVLTYILIVAPVGVLMRWFGTDPLTRRLERMARSYWQPHEPRRAREHFDHMS